MTISLNEMRARANAFAKAHAGDDNEHAHSQSFLNDFFHIFDIRRAKVATFEHRVPLDGENYGFIDLFWPKTILIEMKSRGKDLGRAKVQAFNYAAHLPAGEAPSVILCSDFATFDYYDMENGGAKISLTLDELAEKIELFTFLIGSQRKTEEAQVPVNIRATELLGAVHDRLKALGYSGHDLEVYLVRLLFCMFADDTGIFPKDALLDYVRERTAGDGSDLASKFDELFDILNTPVENRMKNLDADLARFPYVNGQLFANRVRHAAFDAPMRSAILKCCALDWSHISPAIFGSMFQSVMNPEQRRSLGAHYTSEENILKLINPLFLESLWDEFDHICNLRSGKLDRLQKFHRKTASMKFLDPACGCGNFLVVTYRELRRLELALISEWVREDPDLQNRVLDIDFLCRVDVNQFYGIEIEDFPAQIAKVALWLTDHQMNIEAGRKLGGYYVRVPLRTAPTIINANAMTADWNTLVPKGELSCILGNPPFGGTSLLTAEQKADQKRVFHGLKGAGVLDFVTCWYRKAAEYIQGTDIEVGFVSTNSICQGEQAPVLWKHLIEDFGVKINFAHQTFKWSNEAKGKAAVYCVIIGFGLNDRAKKSLYTYATVKDEPEETAVKRINEYLVEGPNVFLQTRNKPICDVPLMFKGCQLTDFGHYLFKPEEKDEFIAKEPDSAKWFRPWVGGDEFIKGKKRYYLCLIDCPPEELRKMKHCQERIQAVVEGRLKSTKKATVELAKRPRDIDCGVIAEPPFLGVPCNSSETRAYIPIGFLTGNEVASNTMMVVPHAAVYHFGVLTSSMSMAWTRCVCGRLKSDYRYSGGIVYNNFPWPEPAGEQKGAIEAAAQGVLGERAKFPNSTFADLYDPNTMPSSLLKAHQKLDRAVERGYRSKPFRSDAERAAFLFERYAALIAAETGKSPKTA